MEVFQIIIAVIFAGLFLVCLIAGVWSQLEDSDEKKGKSGNSGKNIILAIIIVFVVFLLMGMCQGKGGEWEPRHTQNMIIEQKNVNITSLMSENHCI